MDTQHSRDRMAPDRGGEHKLIHSFIHSFFRRSKRCGFCPPDLPSFVEMLEDADDRLFNKINNNDKHVLHCLLPPSSVAPQHYELRQRAHNRALPTPTGRLTDSNLGSMQLSMRKLNLHTILQNYPLLCCCHVLYKLLYPSIRAAPPVSVRVRVRVSVSFSVTLLRMHGLPTVLSL